MVSLNDVEFCWINPVKNPCRIISSDSDFIFYLHMGVRKWYYLWLAALGFLLVSLKFFKKNIFFLFLWNFIVLYPFLTSKETELWHLIPVYLPLSLIVAVGVYEGINFGFHILKILKVW